MARERMISRTVVTTELEILCMDITNAQVTIKTFTTFSSFPTHEKALQVMKKIHDTDNLKLVNVNSMKETEDLYGMSELDFINNAIKLDKETRKPIEVETKEGTTNE